MRGTISLTARELQKLHVIKQLAEGKLKQSEAAETLQLTARQIRRLLQKYRDEGSAGFANKARGKPGNHQLSGSLKDQIIGLIKDKYSGFGPTLASEKLKELDNIEVGAEALRQIMIKAELWQTKKQKPKHRTRRERRACFGAMEQFDGCRHDWFEGRLKDGEFATLLASRDDANNHVEAWFLGYEGTKPVMRFWQKYFVKHGKPVSIYLDRHSTYKINFGSALDDDAMLTQFGRAMKELGIEVINANSPQAKGRIENLFGTLQDRLVKELRLANISDIKSANRFLQSQFLPKFNARFCIEPASAANAHTKLLPTDNLETILSVQTKRYINRDFTVRFKNQWFQLAKLQPTLVLPGNQVTIEERLDKTLHIRLKRHYLKYAKLDTKPAKTKQPIALTSNPNKSYKPAPDHPWRKFTLLPYNITSKSNQKRPSKKIS